MLVCHANTKVCFAAKIINFILGADDVRADVDIGWSNNSGFRMHCAHSQLSQNDVSDCIRYQNTKICLINKCVTYRTKVK